MSQKAGELFPLGTEAAGRVDPRGWPERFGRRPDATASAPKVGAAGPSTLVALSTLFMRS